MGLLHPLNIFLGQEIDRMRRVVSSVRNTLKDLKLAIDGTIIMSESLRDALDCMYDARIPNAWKKVRRRLKRVFWHSNSASLYEQSGLWGGVKEVMVRYKNVTITEVFKEGYMKCLDTYPVHAYLLVHVHAGTHTYLPTFLPNHIHTYRYTHTYHEVR